jgi:hypothetical protein
VASVKSDCYGKVLCDGWKTVADARPLEAQRV